MSRITHIDARQILDSRGHPTVEADVFLEDGSMGRASVPSGASTGAKEACELRDGGKAYDGKGVLQAAENVCTILRESVVGMNVFDQFDIDKRMVDLDGTDNKSRLGANAILAVSLATAKAAALSKKEYLFEYLAGLSRVERTPLLPMPMCNLINGGKHAVGSTDIQEYMVLPVGAENMFDAVRMSAEVFHALGSVLKDHGYRTTVGDEGGYAPPVTNGNSEVFELLIEAVEKAGYFVGDDFTFAIDVAADTLYDGEQYVFKTEGKVFSAHDLLDYYETLTHDFPLVSIEDGLHEDDWGGWQQLTVLLGDGVQLVGDDFLATNPVRLRRAINESAGNAVIIKPNQIGTLTETIDAVDTAHEAGWNAIIAHRSGETEDTTIAHLAVGLATGEIKTGSLSRTDRTAKYNELLRIEEVLGENARFGFIEE